jgi:hypothetical protein
MQERFKKPFLRKKSSSADEISHYCAVAQVDFFQKIVRKNFWKNEGSLSFFVHNFFTPLSPFPTTEG